MFILESNTAFINKAFTHEKIGGMHETMVRLYEAAKALKGLDSPTDVAKALNQSQQTVNNWERRGMSQGGMLKAQTAIGCSATWLLTGQPPMTVSTAERGSSVKPVFQNRQSVTRNDQNSSTGAYNLDLGSAEQDLPSPTEEEFALVPQLDVVAACGEGRFHDHVAISGEKAFARSRLREYGVPVRAARLIVATGGSMSPRIQNGRDVLLNIEDREPKDNKIYAICTPYDGLVLKRLVREYNPAAGAEVWMLKSDNPDKIAFPDKMLPPDDRTMIVGRAVWTDNLL
jgi:phage repressor protein C with HTH and peptisase S24 domain